MTHMDTPKATNSRERELTDLDYRNFAASKGRHASKGALWDGGGLYLKRTPAGACVWRIKYRYGGKERLYAAGVYPGTSLAAARSERDKVKERLHEGRDPVQQRKVEKAANVAKSFDTFAKLAEAWLEHEKRRKRWSPIHYQKSRRAIERDVLPELGKFPVTDIRPVMVTNAVKAILARDVRDTAAKILQHVTGIFTYAMALGLLDGENPAVPAQKVLPAPEAPKHRPALLTFPELGDVLRGAEAARLSPSVRLAHRLCAFAPGARIGNVVAAEWREFDLGSEVPTWIIPRKKMKAKGRHHDHKIILPEIIAAELRQWRHTVGANRYLFSGATGKPTISRESLEKVYRVTLGLRDRHSPHGWRSSYRTLAEEEGKFERDALELALDHVHDSEIVRAYDRGDRLKQRIKLAQWWGEQLAMTQRGADVVQLTKRA